MDRGCQEFGRKRRESAKTLSSKTQKFLIPLMRSRRISLAYNFSEILSEGFSQIIFISSNIANLVIWSLVLPPLTHSAMLLRSEVSLRQTTARDGGSILSEQNFLPVLTFRDIAVDCCFAKSPRKPRDARSAPAVVLMLISAMAASSSFAQSDETSDLSDGTSDYTDRSDRGRSRRGGGGGGGA
jgi:hypothetical protein